MFDLNHMVRCRDNQASRTKKNGAALRKLKKSGTEDENGQLMKFKGRLTDNAITALNVYYVGAI